MPRREIPFSSLTEEDRGTDKNTTIEEAGTWEEYTDLGDLEEETELDFSPNPRSPTFILNR